MRCLVQTVTKIRLRKGGDMGTLFVVADEVVATSLGGVHNVRSTDWDLVSFVFLDQECTVFSSFKSHSWYRIYPAGSGEQIPTLVNICFGSYATRVSLGFSETSWCFG